jgi:tetratricopeptide (TPR) repeat protein
LTELDTKRQASELLEKGRLEEAIAKYKELLEHAKRPNPAILNLIGDIYVRQGDYQRAFESFLTGLKVYTEEGLFHNAIAVGKKILRMDREQTDVYGLLGNLYARQGLGMDCIKFLSEYSRRREEDGEYPVALAAFAEACEILPEFPEIHTTYGNMLERVDRREDAAARYDAAARALDERDQPEKADEWRRRARKLRGVSGPPPRSVDRGTQAFGDLMSLRNLDGDTGGAGSEPGRDRYWGRIEEPEGVSTTAPTPMAGPSFDSEAPWKEFDPGKHPDLPPPPPLPPRAAPSVAEASLAARTPESPAADTEGLVLNRREPDLEGLDTPVEASALDSLTGIIMPPGQEPPPLSDPAAEAELAAAEPTRGPTESPVDEEIRVESLEDLSPLDILSGLTMGPAEPATEEPSAEPIAKGPTTKEPVATPAEDESGISLDLGAGSDLEEFFETAAQADSEQAIIIGDDFELVREGGDVNEVIADFREATAEILDLDDHQAHYDLGTTYLEMELFDEAAAEYEIAARGESFALASREMLGYCFLRKGKIDLAIRELERGLGIPGHDDRDKLGLLYNLGIACGVLDQESRAIEYFQRILELDPDFRDTGDRLERLVQNSP